MKFIQILLQLKEIFKGTILPETPPTGTTHDPQNNLYYRIRVNPTEYIEWDKKWKKGEATNETRPAGQASYTLASIKGINIYNDDIAQQGKEIGDIIKKIHDTHVKNQSITVKRVIDLLKEELNNSNFGDMLLDSINAEIDGDMIIGRLNCVAEARVLHADIVLLIEWFHFGHSKTPFHSVVLQLVYKLFEILPIGDGVDLKPEWYTRPTDITPGMIHRARFLCFHAMGDGVARVGYIYTDNESDRYNSFRWSFPLSSDPEQYQELYYMVVQLGIEWGLWEDGEFFPNVRFIFCSNIYTVTIDNRIVCARLARLFMTYCNEELMCCRKLDSMKEMATFKEINGAIKLQKNSHTAHPDFKKGLQK